MREVEGEALPAITVDEAEDLIPADQFVVEGAEVNEEAVTSDLTPLSPEPTQPTRKMRIVVLGGRTRLSSGAEFSEAFTRAEVQFLGFPVSDFEAGVFAAAADLLIFDLAGYDFGQTVSIIPQARKLCPRAVIVALLEDGMTSSSIPPSAGVHLSVSPPFTPAELAGKVEGLML